MARILGELARFDRVGALVLAAWACTAGCGRGSSLAFENDTPIYDTGTSGSSSGGSSSGSSSGSGGDWSGSGSGSGSGGNFNGSSSGSSGGECGSPTSTPGLSTIVSGQQGATSLALDPTSVYWVENTDNTAASVVKMDPCGGSPVTLATQPFSGSTLAVDATSVYWLGILNTGLGSALVKVPVGGGATTTLFSGSDSAEGGGMAVDATSVYWSDEGGRAILSVPIGGGAVTTLASQVNATQIAVDATNVYWLTDAVMAVPLGGGTPVSLTGVRQYPFRIVTSGGSVYWTESVTASPQATYAVIGVPAGGGSPTRLASLPEAPTSLAADGSSIYTSYADDSGGSDIVQIPTNGDAPTTTPTSHFPGDIVVLNASVDWIDTADSSIVGMWLY